MKKHTSLRQKVDDQASLLCMSGSVQAQSSAQPRSSVSASRSAMLLSLGHAPSVALSVVWVAAGL